MPAIAAARAPLVGVCIDGARLASPGLIAAVSRRPRSIRERSSPRLNYQLGPALHYDARRHGYDQAAEERLLADIDWPTDGYKPVRGLDAGISRRTRPVPSWKATALFLSRALWDELGGYRPRFRRAGRRRGQSPTRCFVPVRCLEHS